MNRVVITGMNAITPIGNNWKTVSDNLKNKSQVFNGWMTGTNIKD